MILIAIAFIIWVLVMLLLSKHEMDFFSFVIGSIGLFFFLILIGQDTFQQTFQYAVAYCSGMLGGLFRLCVAHPDYSMITVYFEAEAISFFVDYECSGIIEMLVYICLLAFYPIYKVKEKIILILFGTIYIFIANVIRVFVICLILKAFGPWMLFFSHTVFARLLFFFMMVILYYVVFTRPHILKQKVGNLTYDK